MYDIPRVQNHASEGYCLVAYHGGQCNPLYTLREGISTLELLQLQFFVAQTILTDVSVALKILTSP